VPTTSISVARSIFLLDAVHGERNLAEEDDVRAEAGTADAAADLVQTAINAVVFNRGAAAVGFATGFGEFAVHVNQAPGSGALVEIVDILGAEKEAVAEAAFQLRQGEVRGIGLGLLGRDAAS